MSVHSAGRIVEAAGHTLTVGQLRRLIDGLPDDSSVLVDGRGVRIATDYNLVLYMDTGSYLPNGCPACGGLGCHCGDL